jgi:hypothetical protein
MLKSIKTTLILLVLLGMVSILCCKNKNSSLVFDYRTAYKVASELRGIKPDTVVFELMDGKRTIAAYFSRSYPDGCLDELAIMLEQNGRWKIIYQDQEPGGIPGLEEIELVDIDGSSYLYYVWQEAGNQTGGASFTSVNIRDLTKCEIVVCGQAANYSEIKPIAPTLMKKSKLLKFLQDKLAVSDLVYHPKPEDFDLNRPQNATERWSADNNIDKSEIYSSSGEPHSLKLYWYDANLLELANCSRNDSAEGNKYRVVALFKNDVVCVDKKTGKSCVLLPRWPYRGFEKVSLTSEDEVVLLDWDEKIEFIVNIPNATVRKVID